jgi:hypothetical protein
MQIRFERPAGKAAGDVIEEFELSLTRPIGITIESAYNSILHKKIYMKCTSNLNTVHLCLLYLSRQRQW